MTDTELKKRYALFSFPRYYPCGGWGDFVEAFESVDAAKSHLKKGEGENAEIVDLLEFKVVSRGRGIGRYYDDIEWDWDDNV